MYLMYIVMRKYNKFDIESLNIVRGEGWGLNDYIDRCRSCTAIYLSESQKDSFITFNSCLGRGISFKLI